jgi:hypothetical protein
MSTLICFALKEEAAPFRKIARAKAVDESHMANHNNFGTLVGRVALRPDAPRSTRPVE